MKIFIELLIQMLVLICIALIIIYLILLSFCGSSYQTKNPSLYRMCPLNYSVETTLSNKGKFNICLKNKKICTPNEEWVSTHNITIDQETGCYVNSPCKCILPNEWKKVDYDKYICK